MTVLAIYGRVKSVKRSIQWQIQSNKRRELKYSHHVIRSGNCIIKPASVLVSTLVNEIETLVDLLLASTIPM